MRGNKPSARKKVIRLATESLSKANIAKQLKIGEATIYQILIKMTYNC